MKDLPCTLLFRMYYFKRNQYTYNYLLPDEECPDDEPPDEDPEDEPELIEEPELIDEPELLDS